MNRWLVQLDSEDEAAVEDAQRHLRKASPPQRRELRDLFDQATGPRRRRLAEILGRSLRAEDDALPWLLAASADADPRVRRPLLRALGRLGGDAAEARLLTLWRQSRDLPELRAIARGLTSLGSPAAREALQSPPLADPELERLCREGQVLGGRAAARSVEGSFVLSRAEVVPRHVVFHVRSGLETLLLEELQQREPEWRPHVLGHGRVGAWTTGDLLRLQRPRLALFFGFPMPEVPSATDECDAVAQSLTGRASRELLSTRFAGALRYRLEWHGRGHQRAASLRVAELVRRRWPELVNDTQNAPWEARIVTSRAGVHVEWVPRGLEDPRFAYRRASVPAASHPTIAAALARLGGVQEHDVVWDPFVGSGTELAERALLGPYRQLLGTDRDPKALTAAEANLRDVTRCSLILADALEHTPHLRPTLVLTNPPLGRRCPTDVERLTRRVLERCAGLLGPDGRLAWITPSAALRPEGFRTERRFEIDLGGFQGEMQLLRPR